MPLVLLVDDFLDALDMYREYLIYRGYSVTTAKSGEEAIRAAAVECPDVVLMDVQMPDMNGVEAMRILRSREEFARVPIVALTAHAMDNERQQLLIDGFDEVIPKPCLPNALADAVERLLEFPRTSNG